MFIATLVLITAAAAETPAAPLDTFFDEFAQKRSALASLRADYLEKSEVDGETTSSPGKLLYIRPQRIIRKTRDPETTILMDARRAYLYEPDVQQVQIFDLRDDPQLDALFLGFDEDLRKLQEGYDLKLVEEKGVRGLKLTPKFEPHDDPLFEELRIDFEEKNLLPARIVVVNSDGGKTVYEISNFVINGEVDPSESQIALPEGTAVIENDTARETIGAGGRLVPEPLTPGSAPASDGGAAPKIEVQELEPLSPSPPAPESAPK